jgi:hypothetical protein
MWEPKGNGFRGLFPLFHKRLRFGSQEECDASRELLESWVKAKRFGEPCPEWFDHIPNDFYGR